jgi:hypothetical protein
MSLTPDRIHAMRSRDAADARDQLFKAEGLLLDLERAIGVWADSVRATAELRHGADAPNEVLWADPDYSAALDAVSEIAEAKSRLQKTARSMNRAEQDTADVSEGGS